jgi:plasmid stabilization system protein ParE
VKAYAIRWSARARAEVEEIRAYLGPGLAVMLDAELELATERLSANPEIAPRAWWRGKRHPRVRCLILLRCPFHLYYAVEHAKEGIVILSLWHEKRRPPKL